MRCAQFLGKKFLLADLCARTCQTRLRQMQSFEVPGTRHEDALALLSSRTAHALLAATPERIDDSLLAGCHSLGIVACTFRIPEHIDIAACTRRGIWVTNVMSHWLGKDAEIEAARNILDVLSGDTPRGALNEVLQTAA